MTTRRWLLAFTFGGATLATVLLILADALNALVLATVAAVILLGLLGLRMTLLRTQG